MRDWDYVPTPQAFMAQDVCFSFRLTMVENFCKHEKFWQIIHLFCFYMSKNAYCLNSWYSQRRLVNHSFGFIYPLFNSKIFSWGHQTKFTTCKLEKKSLYVYMAKINHCMCIWPAKISKMVILKPATHRTTFERKATHAESTD